jgi:hypothetical protein
MNAVECSKVSQWIRLEESRIHLGDCTRRVCLGLETNLNLEGLRPLKAILEGRN